MSYDAMTAHVSIVLARYMLLSLEKRRKIDKRSIDELFYVSCDELQDLQYMDALIMVLKKLVSMITEKWPFLEKELNAMLDSFLDKAFMKHIKFISLIIVQTYLPRYSNQTF